MYGGVRRIRIASFLRLNSNVTTTCTTFNQRSNPRTCSLLPCFSHSRLHFSSQNSSPPPSILNTSNPDDVLADVSTPELKNRIKRYEEGDNDALPLIFEAILARKLIGKHEDTDDELMEDFRSKYPRVQDQLGLSGEDDLTSDDSDSYEDADTVSDEDVTDSDEDLTDTDEELSD